MQCINHAYALFFEMDIELLPLVPEDFPKLISWAVSEDFLLQWTGRTFSYPLDEKQLNGYYELTIGNNPKRSILKAVHEGIHVGNITIDWAKSNSKEAALTCIIVGDNSYKGKGIGEVIVNEASKIAFDALGKKKLFLNVFDFNLPAIKCYERCGFREVFREKLNIKGREYVNLRMERSSFDS